MRKSNKKIDNKLNINFQKLHKKAVKPAYAKDDITNAGLDLTAVTMVETDNYIEYGTGIAVEIPQGYLGLLMPRSSNSKYDLLLCNGIGLIDSNYRGELKFRFKKIINPTKNKFSLNVIKNWFGIKDVTLESQENYKCYKIGEQVGQLVILPYPTITLNLVDELSETNRGSGGFGSTTITDNV